MWPVGLERLVAERARRPPGGHDRQRPLHERARRGAGHPHAQAWSGPRPGPPRGRGPRSPRRPRNSCASITSSSESGVPAQRHRTDAELLGDRGVERVEVVAAQRRGGRDRRLSAGAAQRPRRAARRRARRAPGPAASRGRPTRRAGRRGPAGRTVRSPGWPTVPATKRSGWSKRRSRRGTRTTLSRRSGACPSTDDGVGGGAGAA